MEGDRAAALTAFGVIKLRVPAEVVPGLVEDYIFPPQPLNQIIEL
ncbi:hypothetical protein [Roseibium polysiphoniae]|nr:hypothetical protein [Roseibium polysiphoniae]